MPDRAHGVGNEVQRAYRYPSWLVWTYARKKPWGGDEAFDREAPSSINRSGDACSSCQVGGAVVLGGGYVALRMDSKKGGLRMRAICTATWSTGRSIDGSRPLRWMVGIGNSMNECGEVCGARAYVELS